MKAVFCSSEIVPYASTGGLGEVAHSLPAALRRLGVDVWRVMPMYRQVLEGPHKLTDTGIRLRIPVGFRIHTADVWTADSNGLVTYFIRRDEYFDRRELYALPDRPYTDNFERFVFFQKAVVSLIDHLQFKADIVHGNDWTCGLIPLFLRHGINGMGRNGREKSVFTIHNLGYQGVYAAADFPLTNLPFSAFSIDVMEFYDQINCLKAGLTTSGVVTTVSRSYADEIRTKDLGSGLDGVLRNLGDRLLGIQNGVDYEIWNPGRDALIKQPYDRDNMDGKIRCKEALLARSGFPAQLDVPVAGIIVRLVDHKGVDLLEQVMPRLMTMGLRIVLLGSGQENYQNLCREWARRWPEWFSATIGFDQKLAHRIESGSDMFLMPSKVEPCGLSQLFALRYGTIPIVHATGGLKDTIRDVSDDRLGGNGFSFSPYTEEAFLGAVRRALDLYADREAWSALRMRAMSEDHSWDKSAAEYLKTYASLVARGA